MVDLLDWRCTTQPGKLYLHFLKWPGASFELNDAKGKVTKAYLLDDRQALAFSQDKGSLKVTLPTNAPGKWISVLCLELQ